MLILDGFVFMSIGGSIEMSVKEQQRLIGRDDLKFWHPRAQWCSGYQQYPIVRSSNADKNPVRNYFL